MEVLICYILGKTQSSATQQNHAIFPIRKQETLSVHTGPIIVIHMYKSINRRTTSNRKNYLMERAKHTGGRKRREKRERGGEEPQKKRVDDTVAVFWRFNTI
ncbi:hypothetical protein AAHE18_01G154200 [Arachis hypogaea]